MGTVFMINEQSDHSDGATPRRGRPMGLARRPQRCLGLSCRSPTSAQLQRLRRGGTVPSTRQLIRRIEELPREAGWVLVTAGVIGRGSRRE